MPPKILIALDQLQSFAEVIADRLQQAGYEVVISDKANALENVDSQSTDLLFIEVEDYEEGCGIGFVLHHEPPTHKIAMLSMQREHKFSDKLVDLYWHEPDEHFTAPFVFDELPVYVANAFTAQEKRLKDRPLNASDLIRYQLKLIFDEWYKAHQYGKVLITYHAFPLVYFYGQQDWHIFEASHPEWASSPNLELTPTMVLLLAHPKDTFSEVDEKIRKYLDKGVKQVWIADMRRKMIIIESSGVKTIRLTEQDTLTGGDILPGFEVPVSWIFS